MQAYQYDTAQEGSDGMIFTRPDKCRYGMPSHFEPWFRAKNGSGCKKILLPVIKLCLIALVGYWIKRECDAKCKVWSGLI